MCLGEILEGYTHQGKMMIELGLSFVFGWAILYIALAVSSFEISLYPTAPFLAFGVLCVFLGITQKKVSAKKRRKVEDIGGMEELGLAILILEFIAAVLILLFIGGYALTRAGGVVFIASMLFSIALSIATFYVYWLKHSGRVLSFKVYDNLLLFVSILSHMFWTSMLSSVV